MTTTPPVPDVDVGVLRCEIQNEYAEVAKHPDKGFHFHTGRKLAQVLEYEMDLLDGVPESAIESFAGTGNPFSLGGIPAGSKVVDIGSGAGIDSLIAANMVGSEGQVIGIDMTTQMLDKARQSAADGGFDQVEFREGFIESLPVDNGWADVIISNGVMNLCPDKQKAFGELHRILKPGGKLQIADILVAKEVPMDAKKRIDLWTG